MSAGYILGIYFFTNFTKISASCARKINSISFYDILTARKLSEVIR